MNSDYKTPKIAGIFLVKFDVKTGNEIVWSQSAVDLTGVEFKVLPSGIHEFSDDLILYTHRDDKLYYGLSKFKQVNLNQEPDSEDETSGYNTVIHNDRSKIKMYSLGILCYNESKWQPNNFISHGFEYVGYLDQKLTEFLESEDLSVLEAINIDKIPVKAFNNPINELPDYFNKFGPLIFKIFKLSLLRKRIIIFNLSKKDNYKLQIFNYLISVMSIIPKDLKFEFNHYDNFIQPLYNICLNDLNSDFLSYKSYIATTNDDILMYQPIYDYAILVEDEEPRIFSFESIQKHDKLILKTTFSDYSKFKIIYNQLISTGGNINQLIGGTHSKNASTDNLSINTANTANSITGSFANSIFSNFKIFGYNNQNNITYEPNWWRRATYPLSWTQYIWSAFSWFASAGQYNNQLDQVQGESQQGHNHGHGHNSNQIDTYELVEVIGYFHKLTKKWCYLVEEFVSDSDEVVELTYQDLIDLELDPYNRYDLEFIKEFITTYWEVESVVVSSGLSFFC